MLSTKIQFQTVDEYIGTFPKDVQKILEKIRQTIWESVPSGKEAASNAEETISYQIPAFKLNGNILVYFAAFKNHIGFYPPAPKAFKKEVSPYEGPKGNLKFPIDKPMPLSLIKKIVKYRVKENLEKVKKKNYSMAKK